MGREGQPRQGHRIGLVTLASLRPVCSARGLSRPHRRSSRWLSRLLIHPLPPTPSRACLQGELGKLLRQLIVDGLGLGRLQAAHLLQGRRVGGLHPGGRQAGGWRAGERTGWRPGRRRAAAGERAAAAARGGRGRHARLGHLARRAIYYRASGVQSPAQGLLPGPTAALKGCERCSDHPGSPEVPSQPLGHLAD